MVIWSRLGILGLLIPVAIIVIAIIGAEKLATQRLQNEEQKPAKQAPAGDDAEEVSPEKAAEDAKAAERKRVTEREKATKRAEGTGYLIGGLVSAAVLWPLGRWMNRSESDQPSGPYSDAPASGGHTLFFIPMEYWAFVWPVIGLFKFTSN